MADNYQPPRPYRGRTTAWSAAMTVANYVASRTGARVRVYRDVDHFDGAPAWGVREIDSLPPGLALAERHIAEAKARAGIGGAR